jgi:hypothetical protein
MRGWRKDVGKVTETKRHAPCAIAEKGVTREVLITSRFGRHFLRATRMPYAVSILRRNVPLDDHSHVDWGWMAPLESEKDLDRTATAHTGFRDLFQLNNWLKFELNKIEIGIVGVELAG